jgi:hypothetical protein
MLFFFGNVMLYAQSGIFESYLVVNKNNAGNVYYDLQATTANPDFNATNSLGTFDCSSTLILNGAENKTFKCGTDNITNGWLNYRIYEQGNTPPAFTSTQIFYTSDDGTALYCSGTSNDQTWQTVGANINVLAGLNVNTSYVLEVYTHADFTYSAGSGTHFANNDPDGAGPIPPNNYLTTFSIDDTTAPTPDVANLSDITTECEVTSLTAPTATDNCGGSVTVTNNASLPIATQGTTVVTWTYDDGNGNTSTQNQNVIVNDITNPVIPTLADVTGECSATATAPTTTDNCSGVLTGTTSDALIYNSQGTFVINWTFDDGNGNTIVVPQNVIVDDITNPVIPTLADVTGECSATATAPTTTDNCSGVLTGTTSDALIYNSQGTFVINWTFDDGNGNTIVVPQNVIVDDITNPVIPTLADVTGECSATATAPTTTDNCSGVLTGTTSDALIYNSQGTFVINWTFDDGNGNTIVVPQNVIVDDITNPVIPTLADVTGECSATATAPTTTDNCSGVLTGTTSDALIYNSQGTFVINWTFDDGNGNTIVVPQNVIVNDITNPVIPTLTDVTGECSATATAPTTTDNCSGVLTGTTTDALNYNSQGTFVINWTFDDGNGNTIVVPQNVIVNDITNPVIPTLADVTGECSATATAPTTTDNCSGVLTGTTSDALIYNSQGTFVINWTFDDGNGNTIVVPQNVIVNDITNPVIPTLTDVTGECSATATAPTTTDNCSGVLTGTTSDALIYNSQGTFVINWTFDDGNGNTIVVPQNVIVDDITNPVIPTLADVTGECSATATAPTTTDNCSGVLTGTTSDALIYNSQGTFVINWTFDDGNGNTIVVPQNVIVDDITAPTPDVANLADIAGECEVTILTPPTATDNCGGTVTVTNDATLPISGEGTTTVVTWTYNDGNGNTSTQTQNVVIDDVTAPTALCQPLTVQLSPTGTINISAYDIDSGSSDNCGIQSLVLDITAFTCADVGPNTVTLTVTDINGNSSNCQAVVTVEDNVIPIANNTVCGSIGPLVLDSVTGEVIVTQAQLNAAYTGTDACGIDTIILTRSTTFGCDDIGTADYEITITDVNGNTNTCNISITIEAPTIAGGIVEGYLDVTNPEPADDLIEVTFCPYDLTTDPPTPTVQSAIFNLTIDPSLVPNILRWEIATYNTATAFWEWTSVGLNAGNPTELTIANVTETTLVRAVIQSGDCFAFSSEAILRIIPPDEPPIIVGLTINGVCFPPEFTIEAESFFEYTEQFGDTGLFNSAQPDGWMVDGIPNDIPASGNNTAQGTWKEVAQEKELAGIRHFPQEGSKFAAVYGSVNSDLETPVFNTIGMSAADARLEFYQAYYLCPGASAIIELSLDGGVTYTEVLATYTGASDTGTTIIRPNGNPNNCNSYDPIQDGYEFLSIDLSVYLNEGTLRVKFSFMGDVGLCTSTFTDSSGTLPCSSITRTVGSSWAIDGVRVPHSPIDEVLEWTDDEGNVVTTGTTVTVTPVTPGTQQYGVTSLVNGCRLNTDDGTEFVTLDASLAYAGRDFSPGVNECGQSTIDLKAYDNTISALANYTDGTWEAGLYIYPGQSYDHDSNPVTPNITALDYSGTQMTGTWSWAIVSQECSTFAPSFSSDTDPKARFTAPPGVYNLTWTLTNTCSDTIQVTISSCSDVNFDGQNDFVSFKNNYALNTDFSLETWVKPENITGTHTIFSKRILGDTNEGYDLSLLSNGRIRFSWFTSGADGFIESNNSISTNRWYHLAITFDGTNYALYIDGINLGTVSGIQNAPDATVANAECLLGAIDPANGTSAFAANYFNGRIDELRIWNTALTPAQIRQMMNQEIENNTAIRGAVVPLDIAGLSWTDLDGYYRMGNGCGDLSAQKGPNGRLRNIDASQIENAPLPYTSRVDGQDWATDNTWTEFADWDAPNSLGIDGTTPIDWNIVQISHNINSGNKDITVLGLISDTSAKVLDIKDSGTAQDETNDGQSLRVTHYLKLDGDIDLFGESQLLQDEGSVLDVTSAGKLERDQQGTTNLYNYNYWSSPVSRVSITSNNNPFSINDILRDGTNSNTPQALQWTNLHDANGSTSPITMSSYWLFAYENYPFDNYAAWRSLSQSDNIATGLGYTMKGSGAGHPVNDVQNYVFVGKPNNGTITTPMTIGNQALIGNPYPSAIDANAFILDNIPGGNVGSSQSTDGTLYFWEHYTSNFTHILEEYEGGYATYNLTGGNPAISPPLVSGNGTPTKLPGRYVPVSQGFFVTASNVGGNIQFKNSQRVFVRETPANSVFIRSSNPNMYQTDEDPNPEIKRIRINFTTYDGAIRPLLLGFIPNGLATDGVDYAYDAENSDTEFPNDMFWRIEGGNYTTQGVGDFDVTSQYPLGLFLSTTGSYEISLSALENFEEAINVYIYDALLGTYFEINTDTFQITLDANNYLDRFYVTFSSEDALSIPEEELSQTIINYLNSSQEIYVRTPNVSEIKEIRLINLLGQEILTWDNTFEFEVDGAIRIPVKNLSEGTYIIKVNTINSLYNTKVIIKE